MQDEMIRVGWTYFILKVPIMIYISELYFILGLVITINGVYKNIFTNKKSHFLNQKFSTTQHFQLCCN
jgi:hypothetical protein